MKAIIKRKKKKEEIFEMDRGEEYNRNSLEFNRLSMLIEQKLDPEDRELMHLLILHRLMAEKALAEFIVDQFTD